MLELLSRIAKDEVPTEEEIIGVIRGPIPEEAIDSLLLQAAKFSNVNALCALDKLLPTSWIRRPRDTIVDVLLAKGITLSVKLLSNAYVAGREQIVTALLEQGFLLCPAVMPYTVLLATVCQKRDYPASLLQSLLEQEKIFEQPFQDLTKEDVYDKCLTYCCINERDDLVALIIERCRGIKLNKEIHSACIGRAISRIGSLYHAMPINRESKVNCVHICWKNLGLTHLSDSWLTKANLGAFITRLDVSRNQLSSIPYSLLDGTLQNLEEVDCSQNKIQCLWDDDIAFTYKNPRYR